jgi:hypothetical protein
MHTKKAIQISCVRCLLGETVNNETPVLGNSVASPRFFQKVDWSCFGITTLLALTVYWFTLSSEVGLEYSGIFSTGAMWPGVSMPPGFPLWSIYGWLFIKLIPFSNIAWRLALASAVAGALTSGLIALMVARVGILVAKIIPNFKNLSLREAKAVRVVCGCVAGLGFAFDGGFWPKAVIADPWSLSLFLLTFTLCLLTRWFFAPQQRRYLYMASLVYGLALCNSQSLLAAALGLPFFVAMADRRLGREIFFGTGVFLCGVLETNSYLHWLDRYINPSARNYAIGAAALALLMWIVLSVQTRRFFSEWKATSVCAALFLLGVSGYFLLPILSMTTPPMNWGYPRTVEGFFHVITRGQYERPEFTHSSSRFLMQLGIYGKIALDEFGLPYLLAAAIPFCLMHKILSLVRRWLIGLFAVWFFTALFMLVGTNPDKHDSFYDLNCFLAASHLLLAVLSGCGLMLIAAIFGQPNPAKSHS